MKVPEKPAKNGSRRTLGCALLAVLVFITPCLLVMLPGISSMIEVYRDRYNVVHDADHQAILAACRELIAKRPADETIWHPDEDAKDFPEAIRQLKHSWVAVTKECVVIELHGGLAHTAVVGYPEGVEGNGTTKLIDGLWLNDGD